MSEDWQVGDLALCVDATDTTITGNLPIREGGTYTVEGIDVDPDHVGMGLHLEGVARPWSEHYQMYVGWNANRFRKIRPDAHEPCEAEFVEWLNRIKRPSKVAA